MYRVSQAKSLLDKYIAGLSRRSFRPVLISPRYFIPQSGFLCAPTCPCRILR